MIHGLSEEEKFELIHPLPQATLYEVDGMPIIRREIIPFSHFDGIEVISYHNLKTNSPNNKYLALMFKNDKDGLNVLWNHPFKKLGIFSSCYAISTPDYSIQPGMNPIDIKHNIYKARWLGVFWQSYGIKVFPAVSWWGEDTFDICFSGIEEGSIVVLSTIGVKNHFDIFIRGYREMINRLKPILIIVYGDVLDGMYGTFVNYKYEDAFAPRTTKYIQPLLFKSSRIFSVKGGVICG